MDISFAKAVLQERDAFEAVRQEIYDEIRDGGKKLSERQKEITEWQQVDFVPTLLGIAGWVLCIKMCRRTGFLSPPKHNMFMAGLPAIPCYVVPFQTLYYYREARYMVEMMREDKTSRFATKLRKIYQENAPNRSVILEDLESGAEICE
eukprot:TRINITY_DN23176_c0_g1_i2.p1 TRINITY_DN23176_c0_g1~~TRINITY_DN23176_c0_g1_i2.p1  ORF type:complete len:175 (+),score=16.05 TRINITY_DN23176_c0_g1_i2:81-527(+)